MTYTELAALIASYMHRDDLTDLIPGFVSLTNARLMRELRVPSMITVVDVTAVDGLITLPADYLDLRELSTSTGNQRYLLNSVSRHQLALYENQTGANSFFYALTGLQIEVSPGSGDTFRLVYWASSETPSATNENTAILTNAPYLYLYGALEEGWSYVQDSTQKAQAQQTFIAEIQLVNADAESARFGEAPQAMGAAQWV
jgi:hypothetical protein